LRVRPDLPVLLTLTTQAQAATAPAPAATAAAANITLLAGTVLMVRMIDTVSSKSAAGASFSTILEQDVQVDGVVAVKAGTTIYGKVASATLAGRAVGKSSLDLRLNQLPAPGGKVPLTTEPYSQTGAGSGRMTAKAAGVGAIIGNNSGNGSSGDGALIGMGVAALKPGETLTISSGTLLEFTLSQPVSFAATR
jgi:hypothetical protein